MLRQNGEAGESAVAARQYGHVASVYDALMTGVPHGVWLSRIEKAARQRGRYPHSALDVACGTGIVTELLYQRGYRPLAGIDIAPAMIEVARAKALAKQEPIQFEVQDAAKLDLPGQSFDLVVSLFDSLNYILDPDALRAAFHRIYQHTARGGVFAFDINSLYALSHNLFTQKSEWGPLRHDWHAHWSLGDRICRVEMEFWLDDAEAGGTRYFTETHIQRAYTIPEIKEWMSDAGFVRIEAFGNYGERSPGPKSDRILFVAERDKA